MISLGQCMYYCLGIPCSPVPITVQTSPDNQLGIPRDVYCVFRGETNFCRFRFLFDYTNFLSAFVDSAKCEFSSAERKIGKMGKFCRIQIYFAKFRKQNISLNSFNSLENQLDNQLDNPFQRQTPARNTSINS